MAREGLRSHLSGSVPISIVAHLVVLLVLVVIPLTDIVLPIPLTAMPSYVLAAALPPPPAPAPRVASAATPGASQPAAPTHAPDRIEPERPAAPPSIAIADAADGGLPSIGGVEHNVGTPAAPPPL